MIQAFPFNLQSPAARLIASLCTRIELLTIPGENLFQFILYRLSVFFVVPSCRTLVSFGLIDCCDYFRTLNFDFYSWNLRSGYKNVNFVKNVWEKKKFFFYTVMCNKKTKKKKKSVLCRKFYEHRNFLNSSKRKNSNVTRWAFIFINKLASCVFIFILEKKIFFNVYGPW